MQFSSLPTRGATRSLLGMAAALVLGLGACSGGESLKPGDGPQLPNTPTPNPQFRQSAFIFDVNTAAKSVKVTSPATTSSPSASQAQQSVSARASAGTPDVSKSLVGGDVIDVVVSNYVASPVGAGGAPPGKVLVTFDLAFTNKLQSVELIRPTFPIPPSGTLDRVYAFPFENIVTTTSGSASGSGNEVIIELPNVGGVDASPDWDGDGTPDLTGGLWNFFNDASCSAAGANDCFRYEAYGAPLGGLATTTARRVGYIIDPTVSNFRSRIIVAADLRNAGPAVTTTVSGTVSSPQRGLLSGVTVNITGGLTGATAAAGTYSIAGVTAGPKSVSLVAASLPAGCTVPAALPINVTSTTPITGVDFSVVCTAAVGTVNGTITRTGTGTQSLTGIGVTITPSAVGTTAVTVNPSVAGAFSSNAVQVGTGTGAGNGTVALVAASLPAGCTATTASTTYTGLTTTTPLTVTPLAIDCVPPPAFYQLNAVWGTPTASSVTVDFSIDMSSRNDPTDASADNLAALSFTANYPTGGRLGATTTAACTRLDAGAVFDVFTRNGTTPGSILM